MAERAAPVRPLVVTTWFGRRAVRLTGSGLVWDRGQERTHIPFGVIQRATAGPSGRPLRWDLLITVATGAAESTEFTFRGRATELQGFADTVNAQLVAQRGEASADTATVRVESWQPPRWPPVGLRQLTMVGLLAVCLAQSVTLWCLGHPGRAAGTWAGFAPWWMISAMLANLPAQLRLGRQMRRLGELRTAHFIGSESHTSTTYNATSHTHGTQTVTYDVYEVVDQLGQLQRYRRVSWHGKEKDPSRTVLVIPGRTMATDPSSAPVDNLGSALWIGGNLAVVLVLARLGADVVPGLLLG